MTNNCKSVYIHFPFCKSKCHYCAFYSVSNLSLKNDYLKALNVEIKANYRGEILETLYFGGGTPSLLDLKDIEHILSNFKFSPSAEITFEANPDSVDLNYLKGLKVLGINRISFGAQTFNDDILKTIGRIHNSVQIFNAINSANSAGFNNISIDLIYGLPSQTLDLFKKDLQVATSLKIKHISLYGLKIENSSYFGSHLPQNLPNDDLQADMYEYAIEYLSQNDFSHYEISNFAKENYHSRHNLNYWKNNNYYGFGASAHGYINEVRYSNSNDIKEYIENPTKKATTQNLSKEEQLEEEIFLGFRQLKGLDTQKINQKFNINFEEKYKNTLSKYLQTGHLKKTNAGYALTTNGILVSNLILSEFLN